MVAVDEEAEVTGSAVWVCDRACAVDVEATGSVGDRGIGIPGDNEVVLVRVEVEVDISPLTPNSSTIPGETRLVEADWGRADMTGCDAALVNAVLLIDRLEKGG